MQSVYSARTLPLEVLSLAYPVDLGRATAGNTLMWPDLQLLREAYLYSSTDFGSTPAACLPGPAQRFTARYSLKTPKVTERVTFSKPVCRKTDRIVSGGTHCSCDSQQYL